MYVGRWWSSTKRGGGVELDVLPDDEDDPGQR